MWRDVVSHAPKFFVDFVLISPDVSRNIEAAWFRGAARTREGPAVRRLRFDIHDFAHPAVGILPVPNPDAGKRHTVSVAGISRAGNARAQKIMIPEVLNNVGNYGISPFIRRPAGLARKLAQPVFYKAKGVKFAGQERQQIQRRSTVVAHFFREIAKFLAIDIDIMMNRWRKRVSHLFGD